jgi:hypothetical protein
MGRESERAQLRNLLIERGVNQAGAVVDELPDPQLEQAFVTIAWWDDQQHTGTRAVTPGMLVSTIRDGGIPGYRRPHQRTPVEGAEPVPNVGKALWGAMLSPDGFTRDEARGLYKHLAAKLNTPIDALIDSVVGPNWEETPKHPALIREDPVEHAVRYAMWVRDDHGGKVDPDCRRGPGEELLVWSMRFWDWQDPLEFESVCDSMRKRLAEEKAVVKDDEPEPAPAPVAVAESAEQPTEEWTDDD